MVSIMRKKRQDLTGLSIVVTGEKNDKPPAVFSSIQIKYLIDDSVVDLESAELELELATSGESVAVSKFVSLDLKPEDCGCC